MAFPSSSSAVLSYGAELGIGLGGAIIIEYISAKNLEGTPLLGIPANSASASFKHPVCLGVVLPGRNLAKLLSGRRGRNIQYFNLCHG